MGLKTFLILLTVTLLGCQTIYLHNQLESEDLNHSIWNSHFGFGMYSSNAPIQMDSLSKNKNWNTFKIERTWPQVFISSLIGPIYSPNTIAWSCESPQL